MPKATAEARIKQRPDRGQCVGGDPGTEQGPDKRGHAIVIDPLARS